MIIKFGYRLLSSKLALLSCGVSSFFFWYYGTVRKGNGETEGIFAMCWCDFFPKIPLHNFSIKEAGVYLWFDNGLSFHTASPLVQIPVVIPEMG